MSKNSRIMFHDSTDCLLLRRGRLAECDFISDGVDKFLTFFNEGFKLLIGGFVESVRKVSGKLVKLPDEFIHAGDLDQRSFWQLQQRIDEVLVDNQGLPQWALFSF